MPRPARCAHSRRRPTTVLPNCPMCRRCRRRCRAIGPTPGAGLCAPKGTPPEIISVLNKEVNLAMADPKIKERIASLGGVALPGSPEDYGRTIAADTEKWAKVVQFSGAHVN